jgi:uncharacterized protein
MLRAGAALAILVGAASVAHALSLPDAPQGRVSDFANALSPAERDALEGQIAGYTAGQTHQIAVALFRSLDGESLEDVSIRLAEKWKIGSKQDNGVLVTVFLDDHKLRIEVGYGVEDKLTDARSSQIIRDVIAPRFRAGDVAGGLRAGIAAIDTAITGRSHDGEVPPPRTTPSTRERDDGAPWWVFVLVFGFIGLIGYLTRNSRGGGGGGWSGGSGGWSSGGWSSGGSSGGSFSGGGGSFGGGGASGSW